MILDENQKIEFELLARPLIRFLNDVCHPHCSVVISTTHAELVEGVSAVYTEDYLKD